MGNPVNDVLNWLDGILVNLPQYSTFNGLLRRIFSGVEYGEYCCMDGFCIYVLGIQFGLC